MPNTTVTITYANGSTREFVASDKLEELINNGEMFGITTLHSDISIDEEMMVSKMYSGNPMSAMGNMMMMKRNAETLLDEDNAKDMDIVIETLNACIALLVNEITSHESGMSPVSIPPKFPDFPPPAFKKGEPLVPVDMTQMDEAPDHLKTIEVPEVYDSPDLGVKEDCPVIKGHCQHYIYQHDRNGEVAIEHCTHPSNPEESEGNCTVELCPIKQGIVTPAFFCGHEHVDEDRCSHSCNLDKPCIKDENCKGFIPF